jgi:DNA-binding HxlR family transcriptional regulator
MKIRENYTCPLEIVHDLIKGKWKTILIFQLRSGKQTFSELKHGIEGISEKMLLQQLKELQEFGIIDKTSYEGYPLHVEYFLTDRGKQLLDSVLIMQNIGIDFMIEHGQRELLEQKGITIPSWIPTKK